MIETYSDESCDGSPSLVYEGDEDMRKVYLTPIDNSQDNYVLYPNPASEKLSIVSPIERETFEIEVRDVTSKILYKENLNINNHNVIVNLNLLNGIYFVSLIIPGNKPIIQKLVISK